MEELIPTRYRRTSNIQEKYDSDSLFFCDDKKKNSNSVNPKSFLKIM